MYGFILQILMMSSLALMIYLVARAVPRVGDDIAGSPANRFDKLIAVIPLEKIDAAFGIFLEKFLRRTRLFLLKVDNIIGGYLNNLKRMSGNGHKNIESKPSIFTSGSEEKKENSAGE
ncbi:MAG: hypothetical protein NTW60_04350 [Candidatus Wolfebacteria bacterium]|nr:hypothetical protein [Candidatus Wolfebacteria bacterium]